MANEGKTSTSLSDSILRPYSPSSVLSDSGQNQGQGGPSVAGRPITRPGSSGRPRLGSVLRSSYNKDKGKQVERYEGQSDASYGSIGQGIPVVGTGFGGPSSGPHLHHSGLMKPSPILRRSSHPGPRRKHMPQYYDNEDLHANFIKRAFENIPMDDRAGNWSRRSSANTASGTAASVVDSANNGVLPTNTRANPERQAEVTLLDMLNNDDPLGIGVTIRRTAGSFANASLSSLASSTSPPTSAISLAERSSIASGAPLLGTSTSRRDPLTAYTFGQNFSSPASATTLASVAQSGNGGLSGEEIAAYLECAASRKSESSDPFDDSRRLRRRSTISGYSLASSELLSLRRGSLNSIENGSSRFSMAEANSGSIAGSMKEGLRWEVWAAAYRDSMLQHAHQQQQHILQQQQHQERSIQPDPRLAGPRSQQIGTSAKLPLGYKSGAVPIRPLISRNPSSGLSNPSSGSIPGTPPTSHRATASTSHIHSHGHRVDELNLFYPLRRQFLAKGAGSRSESNRILIIELCHALEEFQSALERAWREERTRSSLRIQAALSDMQIRENEGEASTSAAALPDGKFAADNVSAGQLDMLASEIDSLIREIVEAVPAFSYALGQGAYGPLPFSVRTSSPLTSVTEERTTSSYLAQIVGGQVPSSSSDTGHFSASTSTLLLRSSTNGSGGKSVSGGSASGNKGGSEAGGFELNPSDFLIEGLVDSGHWWPARLRGDLNEGLLGDEVEHSPNLSLHSFVASAAVNTAAIPTNTLDNDPAANPWNDASQPTAVNVGGQALSTTSGSVPAVSAGSDAERLLEEGKRRWLEYKQRIS